MIPGMVSCLMVTKPSRIDMARRAIECFEAQTYRNRELVIVAEEALPIAARDIIFGTGSLGELRNVSVAHANGEFIAQWDDDDWHHPQRLERQLAGLKAWGDEFDGCTLARWTLADARTGGVAYSGYRPRGWEGSLVARRWRVPVYPALCRGEDTPVVDAMKITMLDEPDLYIYNIHGANTFGPDHFMAMFRQSTGPMSFEARELALSRVRL